MVCGVTDLHLHLDGSLSVETVRKLAAMEKVPLDGNDEQIRQLLSVSPQCRDLNQYLEKFEFPLRLLQSREAVAFAVRDLCERLQASGLMYAEIRFAPQLHMQKGMSQNMAVEAAIAGIEAFEEHKHGDFACNLILCCMRGKDNHRLNMDTVTAASEFLGRGVCALDLAGAEGLYPTRDFDEIFACAREAGVPFTIHAGEAAGPASVQCAIQFGAKRIGHGIRAAEDDNVVRLLAEKQIPLELCPTSNLNTRVYTDLAAYPIQKLLDRGVKVTVNTDNMTVSDTTVAKEFELLKANCKLSDETMRQLAVNGIEASFATGKYKEKMLAALL